METVKHEIALKDLGKDRYMFCNVPVYWAKLREDNMDVRYNEGGVFCLDIQIPEDLAKKFNKEYGLTFEAMKDKDGTIIENGIWRMRLKRNRVIIVDGKEKILSPPDVVDRSLKPVTVNIGNESICNVSFKKRTYQYKLKKGITFDLRGVQVLHLIPYEGVSDFNVVDADFDAEAPNNEEEYPF